MPAMIIWHLPNLEWSIPVVDTPQWHQCFPSSHHTQCPTHCSYRSQLCLHLECGHPPVAVDQLCKKLWNHRSLTINSTFKLCWHVYCTHYIPPCMGVKHCMAGKFGGEFNLADYERTTKLNSANSHDVRNVCGRGLVATLEFSLFLICQK